MKQHHHEITLAGEPFFLLPQKAIYRCNKKQLIVSDIHLGKASHFRKKGIPMPLQSHLKDIDTLHFLLNTWKPHSMMILGDLFHSDYNKEWLWFKSLLIQYPEVSFILVEGNHDILKDEIYQSIPNLVKTDLLEEEHFIFSHVPIDKAIKLNFCGHLHPGFRITGIAKQTEKLPCFYLSKNHLILPAFGHLTGLQIMKQEKEVSYYLITGTKVIEHK